MFNDPTIGKPNQLTTRQTQPTQCCCSCACVFAHAHAWVYVTMCDYHVSMYLCCMLMDYTGCVSVYVCKYNHVSAYSKVCTATITTCTPAHPAETRRHEDNTATHRPRYTQTQRQRYQGTHKHIHTQDKGLGGPTAAAARQVGQVSGRLVSWAVGWSLGGCLLGWLIGLFVNWSRLEVASSSTHMTVWESSGKRQCHRRRCWIPGMTTRQRATRRI